MSKTRDFIRSNAFHDEAEATLAKIPIEVVAKIAATLSAPQTTSSECVIRAYDLLMMAHAGRASLDRGESYQSGPFNLQELLDEGSKIGEMIAANIESIESRPPGESVVFKAGEGMVGVDEELNFIPPPFYEVLKHLMPKVPRINERESRFIDWIAHFEKISEKDANAKVRAWKKAGSLPVEVFFPTNRGFATWWDSAVRERKSSNQKELRAREKTQGKKRTRKPRPPFEKLRKIIEGSDEEEK